VTERLPLYRHYFPRTVKSAMENVRVRGGAANSVDSRSWRCGNLEPHHRHHGHLEHFWDNYELIPTQHNEPSCVAPVGDFTSGGQGGGAGYHEIRHTMSEDTTVFLKQQEEG
jgi:hypothetical protein